MHQTRSFSSPSQYSWNAALRDIQSSQRMDETFSKVHNAIEQHAALLKRDAAVRLRLWLTKLAEQTNNPVWKKNRNAYAKLLLNQLKQGRLEKPFNAAPPAGPLQTLPASLTYAFSLPRTNSTRSTVRAASSVASSQGSPSSQAAEAPQLDDYAGRHASPKCIKSGVSATTPGQDREGACAPQSDSPQLPRQKSGLWGVEPNPSRQPSVAARASSPPQQQKSQSSQLSGILRTGSGVSTKYRAESHLDSQAEPELELTIRMQKSPARAPSRLRDSSTEEAELQCAPPARNAHQSFHDSSAEEGEEDLHQKPYKQKAWGASSADDDDEDEQRTLQHRHSARGSPGAPGQNSKGSTKQPHPHYHTAEEYFSRARVREALSPRRQPPPSGQYPAKARILDLHDNCTLANEQEDELRYGFNPSQHARGLAQDCAQVQLGGTSMKVPRGLHGGRRGDGIDLADDSWQPSKLELQARLGASKERQLELEWRLQQAEQKIAQAQAQQVAQQLAASQPAITQQPASQQPKKDQLRMDLGKLIHKYEKRPYPWGSPRKAASMDHLLPLHHRLGSSDSSFDGMADMSAALKNCTPYSPADIGTGDHPLSQGLREPCLQDLAPKVQHCSSVSLSGGSSSTSSHERFDTHAQLHRRWAQSMDCLHMAGPGEQDEEEEGRFTRKLQEFQKGTDMLRQQTSIS